MHNTLTTNAQGFVPSENCFVSWQNVFVEHSFNLLDLQCSSLPSHFNLLQLKLCSLKTVNKTSENNDFSLLKYILITSFAPSLEYRDQRQHLQSQAYSSCTLHQNCAAAALHSFMIIYFHQLKTGKTHLKPLIMQTREPLCPIHTMH